MTTPTYDAGFKGFVLASETDKMPRAFCLDYRAEYITRKGDNKGAVMFIVAAKSATTEDRMEFGSPKEAIVAAKSAIKAGKLGDDVQTYIDGEYVAIDDLDAKLDVDAYCYKAADRKPSWRLSFMTADYAAEKNAGYSGAKPKAAKPAKVSPKVNSKRKLF